MGALIDNAESVLLAIKGKDKAQSTMRELARPKVLA